MMTSAIEKSSHATVMIVDDEEIVTSAVANLLRLETDYNILTFNCPIEALEHAKRERVDCVVTDFLMPDMDGLVFLREFMAVAPDVPAILLTGYADKENAIRAINEVNLYQYLEKPWDNDHLRMAIRNAVQHRSLERALAERLHELDTVLRDRDGLKLNAEALEKELALAEEIQRSILPRSLSCEGDFCFHARYVPTGRLGGDYYDIAATDEGCFNVIVADVAGHGVPASLGTMLVKVIFHEMTRRNECCDGMLTQMNQRLIEFLPGHQYVTAFALSLNAKTQTLVAAPAGGPHPIIINRRNGDPAMEWRLNGLPLGAFGSSIYRAPEAKTRRLTPGDRILLYTDGLLDVNVREGESSDPQIVVDAANQLRECDGEEFLDRLIELCGAGKPDLPDDVNLLLIDYL